MYLWETGEERGKRKESGRGKRIEGGRGKRIEGGRGKRIEGGRGKRIEVGNCSRSGSHSPFICGEVNLCLVDLLQLQQLEWWGGEKRLDLSV